MHLLTRLGNVGFIFTNADLKEIRDKILSNKVAAPARAGAIAPLDVFVPAGNTGMEPGKTSFFQALGVPTKIARGTIEITSDLKLVEAGSKVGASEATLLNMLNISPFTYGMNISQVYDQGQTFAPHVLDIEESQLFKALTSAIATITTISLAVNYPTLPSVMHSVVNGYKKLLAVAVETDYSWEGIEELKDRIANPDAYASSAPPAATTTEATKEEAPKEEEKEEEKEESEDEGATWSRSPNFCPLLTFSSKASAVSSTRACHRARLSRVSRCSIDRSSRTRPYPIASR
jgi:large subunit ribosomal protein LP0